MMWVVFVATAVATALYFARLRKEELEMGAAAYSWPVIAMLSFTTAALVTYLMYGPEGR